MLFALVVRGGVLWAMRDNLQQDPDAYREIAENLLRHGVYGLGDFPPGAVLTGGPQPTAYRPPLYPVVLSNLLTADGNEVSLAKVAALHLLLGVMTVLLTYLRAKRLVGWAVPTEESADVQRPHWWAEPTLLPPLLAGVLVACDPILLNQQTLVMTETLAAFLAVLSLWCLARFDAQRSWFNAALAGGATGLAILCRPTFLPWLGLVGLMVLFVRGRERRRRKEGERERGGWKDVGWQVANCAALGLIAAVIVSPWAIRNYRVFGKPIVTTTHGGYTLLLGNNPSFYEHLRSDSSGLPWTLRDGEFAHRKAEFDMQVAVTSFAKYGNKEIAVDDLEYDAAVHQIQSDPWTFARACVYRVGQLWSPLPNKLTADESTGRMLLRYATAAWYCGVYVLAAIGIWRLRWRLVQPPWVWGLLLCLTFTAVHTFYWSNLRMRAPLMPFVAIVAAAGVRSGASRDLRAQAELGHE
jgi:hypothetical protein